MRYKSCFVGIPLPEEFRGPFIKTAGEIEKLIRGIRIVDIRTPHITVHYLGEQPQENLKEAKRKAERYKCLLTGSFLKIGGAGVFSPQRPGVLGLEVNCPKSLFDYKKVLSEELQADSPDQKDFFVPHLTIGRIPKDCQREYAKQERKIRARLEEIDWRFEIKKVGIYGINPEAEPKRQKIIFEINI